MNFHDIDGVKVPFNNKWKKIAISLSGGADSAILAYILCSLVKDQEVHIISHIRMWKTKPWQQYDSLNVFNYLASKFPNVKLKRHSNFIAPDLEWGDKGPLLEDEYGKKVSGDNIQIRSFAEYICFQENIDAYFNAVTRNPKNVDFVGMSTRDIDPDKENEHLLIMKHMDRYACHPFRFTEKSWVIKQYKRLGLDELLNITRSCEGEFDGIDYKTYTPGQYVPVCDKCFWCKEREWAIEQSK